MIKLLKLQQRFSFTNFFCNFCNFIKKNLNLTKYLLLLLNELLAI